MLHLLPHLVTQHTARLWLCARGVDKAQLASISLRVNGIEAPVPVKDWQDFPPARSSAWQPTGAMPLLYQFLDAGPLQPDRVYEASASLGDSQPARARFNTLPGQLGDETKPLRVLLSSCYFTGNRRSRLASSLFGQLDRNGLRPHLRIWAGDQVYLDAPWYEFAIKSHSVAELERLHSATYARTWFADQGLNAVLPQGANVFCTDDHDLWNNAPHPSVVARDTSDPTKREAWRAIARALGQTFQGDTANGQRFQVPPLDFFVLDARVNRTDERLFSNAQWQQLRAWAAEPQGLGVLVLGQPLFERASKRRGDLGDYRLADYEREYSELMELLGRATRSTTVLTGDVHFSRVTWSSFPASATARNERRVTELISSPLALVAGGQLLSVFGDWAAAPAKASLPARHSFSGTTMHTDESLHSAAECTMLLEFYRRGQRVFCTVSQWRLNDLDASRPSFRREYFLGISQ
ncbi:hypothetical protein GCM10011487_03000 [Steroidobacter agaridevorans]|uniref:PhoD-like phosphatase metallophosphatase domain-containing protein n=1 Tax=Steroidobacter agaridevorans TaxID=2695856 RepID=A0A829Y515_9GAMM|nr:hypothetical protein [Steroidobacter agaridevorans]GFE78300.1 hypothetical protein GCM10011487_03000 [Steroidobacter agaridevorans]